MNTTKESLISTSNKSSLVFEDVKIDVKVKLSALWVTLMIFYIYADILGFYTPGVITDLIAGEIGGIQITEGFLSIMAIWMAIPSVMIIISLMLKSKANRWVNFIAGILSFAVLLSTFFVGEISTRYTFQAVVEAVLIALILWHAWKWPKLQS